MSHSVLLWYGSVLSATVWRFYGTVKFTALLATAGHWDQLESVKHALTPKTYFLYIKVIKAHLTIWALSYQVVSPLDTSNQYTLLMSYHSVGATCRTHRTCNNFNTITIFDDVPCVVSCSGILWGLLGTNSFLSIFFSKNFILWLVDKVPYAWRNKRQI